MTKGYERELLGKDTSRDQPGVGIWFVPNPCYRNSCSISNKFVVICPVKDSL